MISRLVNLTTMDRAFVLSFLKERFKKAQILEFGKFDISTGYSISNH